MDPTRSFRVAALAAAFLVAGIAGAAEPSNKWRLVVDGRTTADGAVVLRLTPKDGTPTEVETAIRKGTSENEIAHQLVKQLKSAGGKQYHVERDDFEDVLVKKKMGQADFTLELVSSSLPGVNLKFKRE